MLRHGGWLSRDAIVVCDAQNRAMYDEITARQRAGDKAAKRISFTVSAHAPYTVCDASFAKVKELSEELDIPVHIHLHETHDECHLSANGIDGLSRHRSDEVCRPFKVRVQRGCCGWGHVTRSTS